MKKLYSSVTGIEQGSVQLFSDFDSDGPMWTEDGPRQAVAEVEFSRSFKNEPSVFVSLQMVDASNAHNLRYDMTAFDITTYGFKIRFKTWADSRFARVVASWIAIGEASGDGDWNL